MSSWLFLLISTTLLKWVIDRRSYLFALNKKIEIKVHYIKDTRNLQSNLASFGHKLTRGKYFSYKISSKRWSELIKSAEFISYTIQDLHKKAMTNQGAKKVVSDSPGLVDFAIGLVNSVLNLPDGQAKIFRRIQITKVL